MNDKQAFLTIIGGLMFALFGGVALFAPIGLLVQHDGGDDGFGLLWLLLSVLSGIVGLFLSAKWVRKHYPEDPPSD
jgi:hypothetical protein